MKPVTQQAHDLLASLMRGTLAIDATAGNGHDTEFLARLVGPTGTVWAFDIQPLALIRTATRLEEHQITVELRLRSMHDPRPIDHRSRVIGIEADHAEMTDHLPVECRGQVGAIMFNLGYLPGADKSCMTLVRSTLAALDASLEYQAPGGILTVVAYPGHSVGQEEAEAVRTWFDQRTADGSGTLLTERVSQSGSGPQLWALRRTSGGRNSH